MYDTSFPLDPVSSSTNPGYSVMSLVVTYLPLFLPQPGAQKAPA
jgi:hypothetical protein